MKRFERNLKKAKTKWIYKKVIKLVALGLAVGIDEAMTNEKK